MYLITGAAGFIGYHVCKKLLDEGEEVVGVDSFNNYYDTTLKKNRIIDLADYKNFKCISSDLFNLDHREFEPKYICHLAAYAGIPYSLIFPELYERNNCYGTLRILELARYAKVKNFVYASSSSVYGNNEPPFVETMNVDKPLNMYAATKRYNELQAHVYSKAYGVPCTGLRLFTVYGPWGRPDMSIYIWADALYNNRELVINGYGKMYRNYSYIDDVVEGIIAAIHRPKEYEIYNIGSEEVIEINSVIRYLEGLTFREGKKVYVDFPKGEIVNSSADIKKAQSELSFYPYTSFYEGVGNFVEWYKKYYKIKE